MGVLFALLLVLSVSASFPVSVILAQPTQQSAATLSMTGQQFFANGTGLAYFNDGSISKFEHEMTPQEGWYYDNTTIFYTGEIPGISSTNNTKCSGGVSSLGDAIAKLFDNDTSNSTTTIDNSSNSSSITNHTLTIINGANVIENKSKAIQPSPIIRIKAGDTVTWVNEDMTPHDLKAPPGNVMYSQQIIPSGQTIDVTLFSADSPSEEYRRVSCTFTEPGGFHYDIDTARNEIRGAVIVEEDNNTNSTEQEQQSLSGSPLSQQLELPQEQEQLEDCGEGAICEQVRELFGGG
jgi:plastocyanin